MDSIALHRKGEARRSIMLYFVIVLAMFFAAALSYAQTAGTQQESFSSPEEAVKGLVAAVRADDTKAMLAVLGSGSGDLISSGDTVADGNGREKFLKAYDEKNILQQKAEDKWVLSVGNDNWPMPIPIVKKEMKWVFDAQAGREEILNRRIGRNELQVMNVIHAYVDAQHEYASMDCSGSGKVEFAQRLISTEGKHDGLYWEAEEGQEESPLGPLVAQAAKEGYPNADLSPYHGYYFRILKGQGVNAPGGAYDYVVKGRMILGFALAAYPAEYDNSGIMTFIVNQEGMIYQKNLGKDTKQKAEELKLFDPDETWKKVEEPEEE
jgi:hypothetical protein